MIDGTATKSPPTLIVMGVSGAGKSTLAAALSSRLRVPYVDADAHHPASNVEKMQRGQPLTDEDRAGWLQTLKGVVEQAERDETGLVLACSALKATYRQVLGVPSTHRHLVFIQIDPEVARRRVARRASHFMPSTLVDSQFAALEPPAHAIVVDATWPIARSVRHVCETIDGCEASSLTDDS